MDLKQRIALYEKRGAVLENVARQYPEKSAEHVAIREATIALWFGLTQKQGDFLEYLDRWNQGELSTEQKAHLGSMGIDPEQSLDNANIQFDGKAASSVCDASTNG